MLVPTDQIIDPLPIRSLGPTTMGGRVTDLAVYEKAPRIFLVGTAAGGVWGTKNAGTTFAPIFQNEGRSSVGAVTICQSNPKLIWVGTGEGTSRNTSSWGDGIYKTVDEGHTWQNMGLHNSKHFSRIVLDPIDPNTVYAGALGTLWGPNEERGLFKTTNGGRSWQRVLYVDDRTGIADVAVDPSNPKVVLAAAWDHLRDREGIFSIGSGSGIYKTVDGGIHWRKILKGLPTSPLGRIGLSYFRRDPRCVIAIVESAGQGSGLYRSEDGGDSWQKINIHPNQPQWNLEQQINYRHFYFSEPRYDPRNRGRFYLPGLGLIRFDEDGKRQGGLGSLLHPDVHVVWIDPSDTDHLIVGTDGGVYQTRDGGETWEKFQNLPIAQFYSVDFDLRKPYWVYGGLQDNGTWAGPTQGFHGYVLPSDWYTVLVSDGYYVQADPDQPGGFYGEMYGAGLFHIDVHGRTLGRGTTKITPRTAPGGMPRSNWCTPFIVSPWNPRTLYYGADRVYASTDRGKTWQTVSEDLTLGPSASTTSLRTEPEPYHTITTLNESRITAGLIWVGTDDGRIQLTRDGGKTWENVSVNLKGAPAGTWVSRVMPSRFEQGRAYVTLDGHRTNDYATYVFVTDDFGKTWTRIISGLPAEEPCYVIAEGLHNPDLLFLGTEAGVYISLDRGSNWTRYRGSSVSPYEEMDRWPTVPVYDLKIQPQEEDLIVGTHGRSIWILPVGALEELTQENLKKPIYLTHPSPMYLLGDHAPDNYFGDNMWLSRNTQPSTLFCYYLQRPAKGPATITVSDPAGTAVLFKAIGKAVAGLNTITWDPVPWDLQPGDYRVTLTVDGVELHTALHVEEANYTVP